MRRNQLADGRKTLAEIRRLRDSAKASETEETAAENIQEAKEENEDYRGSELPLKKDLCS